MKKFCVSIEVSGEVELEIEARSEKAAQKLAEKIAHTLTLDNRGFSPPQILDVNELIDFEVTTVSEGDDDD